MESDLQITAMPLMEINVICTSYRKANRCVIVCALCCVFSGQLCAAAADLEQRLQKNVNWSPVQYVSPCVVPVVAASTFLPRH